MCGCQYDPVFDDCSETMLAGYIDLNHKDSPGFNAAITPRRLRRATQQEVSCVAEADSEDADPAKPDDVRFGKPKLGLQRFPYP